jgi:trimethylamine--corrinoid protein Co-methyltransferase
MASLTKPLEPIRPTYRAQILSDQQLADFKAGTLQILEEVGFLCPSEKALKIYAEHGGIVDFENRLVKLPADVVLEAMSHAPRFYTMGGRTEEFDLVLDGTETYIATDGVGAETVDFKTGKRRNSKKQDVADMARVADYYPGVGFYWPMVSAQDYKENAPLHELDASLNNTLKHVQAVTLMGEEVAHYAVEVAKIIAGDEAAMRKRPPLSSLICTIAPLAQDTEAMESALVFAEAGLPVGFMSMAAGGSTAPATIPGTMVIGDAEIVSAMVLMQMASPGCPVYHSLMPGVMHPRTGDFLGSVYEYEASLFYAGGVQLAHMWGVPTLAGIGTEAKESGWESAAGIASNILMCSLLGADTAGGLGLRETCTLLTPEALILDMDLYEQARIDAAGLDTSQEQLAIDVIKNVGPGGHFLREKHTRTHLRQRKFSELTTTLNPRGRGYRDAMDVAHEKMDWILENHHPEPLDEAKQKEIKKILEAGEREFVT